MLRAPPEHGHVAARSPTRPPRVLSPESGFPLPFTISSKCARSSCLRGSRAGAPHYSGPGRGGSVRILWPAGGPERLAEAPISRHPSSGAHASSALLGPAAGASTTRYIPHALASLVLERMAVPSPVSDTTSVVDPSSDGTSNSGWWDSSDDESYVDVEQQIFLGFENKWERSDLGKKEVSLFKEERTVRQGYDVFWRAYDKKDLILRERLKSRKQLRQRCSRSGANSWLTENDG